MATKLHSKEDSGDASTVASNDCSENFIFSTGLVGMTGVSASAAARRPTGEKDFNRAKGKVREREEWGRLMGRTRPHAYYYCS